MLDEVIEAFSNMKIHRFFDGTLGAGGHAKAILEAHREIEVYVACDRDPTAHAIARETLSAFEERVKYVRGNFCNFDRYLDELGIEQIEGFLLDLGVSSMQFDQEERGFSFSREGPLDMRMDPSEALTAEDVINEYSEGKLGEIFREFGEERYWRRGARLIVEARRKKRIKTTKELVDVLEKGFPKRVGKKTHPLTRIFQALRIYINKELEVIESTIKKALDRLAPGGRMSVISFHSLEDRFVKHVIKGAAKPMRDDRGQTIRPGKIVELTKKPLIPSRREFRMNRRARSAKLRVVQKV